LKIGIILDKLQHRPVLQCLSFPYRGMEVAVIYGSLPPGTKLAQANKFNDPDNTCKVMVATDAIGLGINL